MQLTLFGEDTPIVPIVEHKTLAAALADLTEIESDEINQPKNFNFVCPQVGTPAFRLLTKYRALGARIVWRFSADIHEYTLEDEQLLEEVQQRYFKSIEKLLEDENDFGNIAYLQEEYADVVASTLDDIIRGELEWHKPVKQMECCFRCREGIQDYTWNSEPRKVVVDPNSGFVKWDKPHTTGQKAVFDKNGKIVRWEKSRGVEIN